MTPKDLIAKPLRKELRTYVLIADVADTTLETTKMLRQDLGEEKFKRAQTDPTFNTSVGMEKWAKDQMIVYLFANGTEKTRGSHQKTISKCCQKDQYPYHHKNLSATVFGLQNDNKPLSTLVLDSFGMNLKIPVFISWR